MIMGRAAENALDIVPSKSQYRELVYSIKQMNDEGGILLLIGEILLII